MGTQPDTAAQPATPTDPGDWPEHVDTMAERLADMPAEDRTALFAAMDELRFAGLPQSYAEDRVHQPSVVSTELAVPVGRTAPTTTANGNPLVPPPNELQALGQMAVTLCAAKTVPAALRDAPNDVFLILLAARDLGVDLSTAIREFHVVEGKVTLSPKVKLAMVRRQGLGRVWPDPANSDQEATWYAVRYDYGEDQVFAFTFTKADADRAKLTGKGDRSAWTTYPQRMLSWRALGYLLDDVFSEVGAGLYSPDEMGAVVDEEGNPVLDVTAVEPVHGTQAPRRRGRNRAAEGLAGPELLADAERKRLQGIIDQLRELPDAKDALVVAWKGADDDVRDACGQCKPDRGCDEHRALWPLGQLPAVDAEVAEARIRGVVLRLAAGEFLPDGAAMPDWVAGYLGDSYSPPADADPDQEAATPATAAVAADPAPEQGNAPPEAPEPVQGDTAAEAEQAEQAEDDTADVIGAVKAMPLADVREHLGNADLPTTGNSDTLRARLAQHLLAIGWRPGQPKLPGA